MSLTVGWKMSGREREMYIKEPTGGIIFIDYEQNGQYWHDCLSKRLLASGINSTQTRLSIPPSNDFPHVHHELTIQSPLRADFPSLKIVPARLLPEGREIIYLALTSGKPISKEDEELWTSSIDATSEKLNKGSVEFQWVAVIGQEDPVRNLGVLHSLKQKVSVGGLTARSSGTKYVSLGEQLQPGLLDPRHHKVTRPIIIEGLSTGIDWSVASRQPEMDVQRFSALLSLAWGSTWTLLQRPIPSGPGKFKVPSQSNDIAGKVNGTYFDRTPKALPKWIPQAWDSVDKDPKLSAALNAFYQGLLLRDRHPSFALLAFVASIETIGRKITGKKIAGRIVGDGEAFRAGVGVIAGTDAETQRFSALYGKRGRSGTAHQGTVHSNKELLGVNTMPSLFKYDPKDLFIQTDLRAAQELSRKLLIRALSGKVKFRGNAK